MAKRKQKTREERIVDNLVLDEYRTGKDFYEGAIVNIYSDFQTQKKFEGTAKLVEKKKMGMTFMLQNENMLTKLENRAINPEIGHLPLTKLHKANNRKYAKLTVLLQGTVKSGVRHVDTDTYALFNLLKDNVSRDLSNPKKLYYILNKYRRRVFNRPIGLKAHKIDRLSVNKYLIELFNSFDNETIISYVQQEGLVKWCHTIWREETWIVEFIPGQYCIEKKECLFNSPFRTSRKLRTLVCISPNEDAQNSDIFHYSTKEFSNVSNADKKELRRLREEKDIEGLARMEALLDLEKSYLEDISDDELYALLEKSEIEAFDIEDDFIELDNPDFYEEDIDFPEVEFEDPLGID